MYRIISSVIVLLAFSSCLVGSTDSASRSLYNAVCISKTDGIIVNLDLIRSSIASGADPNWINRDNKRHLSVIGNYVMILCFSEKRIPNADKAIKYLFAHGAKLQQCDGAILYFPIVNGNAEIVQILLENGASPTSWPSEEIGNDLTPYEEAIKSGNDLIVKLLIKHGAKEVSFSDNAQLRFVEAARTGSRSDLEDLLKTGAEVNGSTRDGATALLNALGTIFNEKDYLKIMFLFENGADVNKCGKGPLFSTPLNQAIFAAVLACKNGKNRSYSENILQELIKRGAFVSRKDASERSPLHIAAKYNHIYSAKLLLEAGAKVMDKDNSGKTPLDLAESGEMIMLLKKFGAKED